MNLYIGNLARDVTEEEIKQEFSAFGEVTSVMFIKDKSGGQPKGFGFVEMPSDTEAEAAITGLKGKIIKERTLDVSQARPRSDKKGGGSFANRRGGSYGNRRGGSGSKRQRRF